LAGGLEVPEAAKALEISEATFEGLCKIAKENPRARRANA
jgi:hypothetical protein